MEKTREQAPKELEAMGFTEEDFEGTLEVVREIIKTMCDVIKSVVKAFRELWEVTLGMAEEAQLSKREFKLVPSLLPHEILIRDKRLNINYCRNNC